MNTTTQTTRPAAEDIHISFDPAYDLAMAENEGFRQLQSLIEVLEDSDDPADWDAADEARGDLEAYVDQFGRDLVAAATRIGYRAQLTTDGSEQAAWAARNTWAAGMDPDVVAEILTGAWQQCQDSARRTWGW